MKFEWFGRVDWTRPRWGIQRHRMGFYIKLGRYGATVWTRPGI